MLLRLNLLRKLSDTKVAAGSDITSYEKVSEFLPIWMLVLAILPFGVNVGAKRYFRERDFIQNNKVGEVEATRLKKSEELKSLEVQDEAVRAVQSQEQSLLEEEKRFKDFFQSNKKIVSSLQAAVDKMPESIWLNQIETDLGRILISGYSEDFIAISNYVTKLQEVQDFGQVKLESPNADEKAQLVGFKISIEPRVMMSNGSEVTP